MEPKSSTDTSALFQLKNLIHLSSFGKEPTEDFLEVVLIAHVTTAAKDLQACSNCSGQSVQEKHYNCKRGISADGTNTAFVPQERCVILNGTD